MRFFTTRFGLKEIIETYWNVNGTGISYVSTSGGEIIETYWNVNYTGGQPSPSPDYEIIETYWNVNYVQNIRQPRQRMK